MSKDLTRSSHAAPAGAIGAPAGVPDPGIGTRISDMAFTAKAYTYESDIPRDFRPTSSPGTALTTYQPTGPSSLVPYEGEATTRAPRSSAEQQRIEERTIASGARQLAKPRRSAGRVVQRRIGWQVTPDLIVITTAERELDKTPDGKYRPLGPWLIEHRQTFPTTDGPAHKRTGTVPEDQHPNGRPTGSTPEGQTPPGAADDSFTEGATVLSLLPASVRSSVLARVPSPTIFDGTALQYAHPTTGEVDRLEVNLIRMNTTRAVVIRATRKPTSTSWDVSQGTYTIAAPQIETA